MFFNFRYQFLLTFLPLGSERLVVSRAFFQMAQEIRLFCRGRNFGDRRDLNLHLIHNQFSVYLESAQQGFSSQTA